MISVYEDNIYKSLDIEAKSYHQDSIILRKHMDVFNNTLELEVCNGHLQSYKSNWSKIRSLELSSKIILVIQDVQRLESNLCISLNINNVIINISLPPFRLSSFFKNI